MIRTSPLGVQHHLRAAEQRQCAAALAVGDGSVPYLRGATHVRRLGSAVHMTIERGRRVVGFELEGGEPVGPGGQVGAWRGVDGQVYVVARGIVVSPDFADGATGVGRDRTFSLKFDERIDPASLAADPVQLRDAAGTATNVSVGPIEMFSSGASATLGSVTDNGDGTYSVTLSAGATTGTATITARVVGSDFTDSAQVVINDPSATSTTASGSTTPPGKPGTPIVSPTNGGLYVTVVPPTTGGTPASYEVTARPGGRRCTVTGSTGSCTLSGLSGSRAYRVTVVASNAGGDSPSSDASSAVTPLASGGDLASTGLDSGLLFGLGLALLGAGLILTAMPHEYRRFVGKPLK